MKPQWIMDTGPLVAYLNKADKYHGWVIEQFNQIYPPFLTCESVISEALFLLTPSKEAIYQLFTFITDDYLKIYFSLKEEAISIQKLIHHYQNIPMSLADACLVRMSELLQNSTILTLDSDFQIYRRYKNKIISLRSP